MRLAERQNDGIRAVGLDAPATSEERAERRALLEGLQREHDIARRQLRAVVEPNASAQLDARGLAAVGQCVAGGQRGPDPAAVAAWLEQRVEDLGRDVG